jgi:hypothetical protein
LTLGEGWVVLALNDCAAGAGAGAVKNR